MTIFPVIVVFIDVLVVFTGTAIVIGVVVGDFMVPCDVFAVLVDMFNCFHVDISLLFVVVVAVRR